MNEKDIAPNGNQEPEKNEKIVWQEMKYEDDKNASER